MFVWDFKIVVFLFKCIKLLIWYQNKNKGFKKKCLSFCISGIISKTAFFLGDSLVGRKDCGATITKYATFYPPGSG